MRIRQGVVLVAVCALGVLGGGSAATACGCGELHGPVVASGSTPHGVPWRIRAGLNGPRAISVEFSFPPPGYADAGYFTDLPYPLPKSFTFTATAGSAFDPYREQDVSGVTARRIARVSITVSDGSTVVARPRLAARTAYRRHAWLRNVRFYDVFWHSSASPETAVAQDDQGRIVDRVSLQ